LSTDKLNLQGGAQIGQAGIRICPETEPVSWNKWSESREWLGDEGMGSIKFNPSEKYHFAFWFQKTRVRLYVNENKELDLPRGLNSGHIYIIRIFYFKGIKTIVNQYD
jgi:OOP family OmpA-OmpF porin